MDGTRRTARVIAGIVLLVCLQLLAGCQASRLMQMFGSPADEQAAKHYVDLLRERRLDAIEAVIDPSQRTPDLHQTLVTMADYVPAEAPISVETIGVQTVEGADMRTISYTFQYHYPGCWLLVSVVRRTRDGSTTLLGLRAQRMPASLQDINRFTLLGKDPLQYGVLFAAVVVPLFCVLALVLCVRTPMRGRKWPWIVFILFGVVSVSVNWTSGQWHVQPISLLLLGAGANSAPFGPWIISAAFPLGAVWFLLRRRQLRSGAQPAVEPPALPEGDGPGVAG